MSKARSNVWKLRPIFNVMDPEYGAKGDGVTDDTAALRLMVTAVNAAGAGTVVFPPGDYKIASQAGLGNICAFANLDGIEIYGYGAKIVPDTTRVPVASEGTIFHFTACKNIKVDGFQTDGPVVDITSSTVKGYEFMRCVQGCRNIEIPNLDVKNLIAGLIVSRVSSDPESYRSKNIKVGNLYAEHCWYGYNCQHSGDNAYIENLTTDTVHRSIYLYGCSKVYAKIRSKDAYSWDVLLGSFAGSKLEDIEIHYEQGTDTTAASDADRVMILAGDATPAIWRNIHVHVNIEYAGAGNTGASAVRFSKLDNAGAFDTVDRGHLWENIKISGKVKGTPHYAAAGPVQLDNLCSWGAGETLRNIRLEDLIVTDHSQGSEWPQGGFKSVPGLVLRNGSFAGEIEILPLGSGDPFTTPITVENFTCPNLWTVSNLQFPLMRFYTGSNHTLKTGYSGKTISNKLASGTKIDTLPAAVSGLEYQFVREAAFEYRVDPQAGDTIRGASAAGKYLSLNAAGNTVLLKCFDAGMWEILASNGALAYEP